MAKCRLTGDWGKFRNFTKNFDKELIKSAKKLSSKEANNIQSDIKDIILNQTQSWTPLKPGTVEDKNHARMLYETGTLANSIQVTKVSALVYKVAPEGNHPSGETNQQIATYHEFGTQRIPARPFIRPVYKDYTKQLPIDFKSMVEEVIGKFK